VKYTEAVNANENALKAGRAEMERVGNEVDAVAKAAIKASDDALHAYDEQQALISALQAKYTKVIGSMSHDTMQAQIDDINAVAVAQADALAGQVAETQTAYDLIFAIAQKATDAIVQKTLESDPITKAHYVKMADDAEIAYNRALTYADQYTAAATDALRHQRDEAEATLKNWEASADAALRGVSAAGDAGAASMNGVTSALQRTAGALDQVITGTVQAGTGFADMTRAAQQLTQDWINLALMSPGSVPRGTLGQSFFINPSTGTIQPRAAGGPVSAGTPYMVGEEGPELFVPGGSGAIVPAGAGGGPTVTIAPGAFVLNYPIVNNPQALDQLARTVGDAILTKLTRAGARL